jgi:ubiquinone biosynthesis accessory factor UbiJ
MLHGLLKGLQRPPDWVVDELQNRMVLFLNHVLAGGQAQDRLRRQKGKPVKMQWGDFHLTLAPPPRPACWSARPATAPDLGDRVPDLTPGPGPDGAGG